MPEYGVGPLNEDFFQKAFDRWTSVKGAGGSESDLLDIYHDRFGTQLCNDLFKEASANGMDTMPKDLVDIYLKVEQFDGREPSSMPTSSKLISREKVARILGAGNANADNQYYVLASVVDEAYPEDSDEILPCLMVNSSDHGASVMLMDGAYSGTVFIVPTSSVSCVSVHEMKKISGSMF